MRRILAAILRSLLLFLLSLLLVAGFYFHADFYAIGLYPLLLLGGLATFIVIAAARLILSGDLPRGRPTWDLTFALEEGDRFARGAADLIALPLDMDPPGLGEVVRGRYETGHEFGRFVVVDLARRFLEDLTDDEARRAGHRSATTLREARAAGSAASADPVVTLLQVRRVEGSR